MNISEEMRGRILNYIENAYWILGEHVKAEELVKEFGVSRADFDEMAQEESFKEAIKNRGLPSFQGENSHTGLPYDLPLMATVAMGSMLNLSDKRSTAAKLKDLGVSTREWQGWLRNEKFREVYAKELDRRFGNVSMSAKVSLAQLVEEKNLPAIQYYHQFTGEFKPNQESILNLGLMIAKLMEVLVEYLKPAQLAEVANRFDSILTGEVTNASGNLAGRELSAAP